MTGRIGRIQTEISKPVERKIISKSVFFFAAWDSEKEIGGSTVTFKRIEASESNFLFNLIKKGVRQGFSFFPQKYDLISVIIIKWLGRIFARFQTEQSSLLSDIRQNLFIDFVSES